MTLLCTNLIFQTGNTLFYMNIFTIRVLGAVSEYLDVDIDVESMFVQHNAFGKQGVLA